MKISKRLSHNAGEGTRNAIRALVPRAWRNRLRSPAKSAEWLWDCARSSTGSARTGLLLPDWGLLCHFHAHRLRATFSTGESESARGRSPRNRLCASWQGVPAEILAAPRPSVHARFT